MSGLRSSARTMRLPSSRRTSSMDSNCPSCHGSLQNSGDSRRSRYSNSAPRKEIESKKSLESIPGISICTSADDTCKIRPTNQNVTRPVVETKILADSLFHLFSCDSASSDDERMFLLLAQRCGLAEAACWASQFGWKIRRPLRVLQAMELLSSKRGEK